MGSKNIHLEPFDKETITKLEIFEDYVQAWIPTFVMKPHVTEIHIFDFFSGPGYDSENDSGSPIRILDKINKHYGNIMSKKTKTELNSFHKSISIYLKNLKLRTSFISFLLPFLSITEKQKNLEKHLKLIFRSWKQKNIGICTDWS